MPPTRALENHVYFAAVNRVGVERGVKFIGRSSIANPWGDLLAQSDGDAPTILYAAIDPALARQKHIIREPGEYELHRIRDRRPAMYGPLVDER